jgi:hypothetical protein
MHLLKMIVMMIRLSIFENLKNDEQIDISAGDNFISTTNTKGSLEFLDLQTKVVCSRYEEEGEEKKGSD